MQYSARARGVSRAQSPLLRASGGVGGWALGRHVSPLSFATRYPVVVAAAAGSGGGEMALAGVTHLC